jgi:hypothetical protein
LPLRSARVSSAVVLSPALGSVTAKQPLTLPWMMPGSMRFFCSSLPKTTIGLGPKMLRWIAEAPLKAAPDSATVCISSAASVMPSPAPPYSSGMAIPSQPASAMAA